MEKINVLHLASPAIGGIEHYIFNHYRYMNRERFQFDFLTQNRGLKDAAEFQEFHYKVKLLPTTAAEDKALFVKQVKEILTDGYTVLHLHTCYWTGFLIEEIAKEAGIHKVIVHSHSTFIDEPEERRRDQLLRQHEAVKRAFTPDLATDFWACSKAAADWLFGPQIPVESIQIMKNAIDLERFQFNPAQREQVRTELGLGDALVLGTTGRLSYQKNHAFLIEIFERFHQMHKNSKLMILGDGELRAELETQIGAKGLQDDVFLLGWKTDVAAYLQAMDYFLLPSRFEGNPISLIEAAASGLPCVIADSITAEAVFSPQIQRIPLDGAQWLDALEQTAGEQICRGDGIELARKAGYDIKRQAKILEEMYRI